MEFCTSTWVFLWSVILQPFILLITYGHELGHLYWKFNGLYYTSHRPQIFCCSIQKCGLCLHALFLQSWSNFKACNNVWPLLSSNYILILLIPTKYHKWNCYVYCNSKLTRLVTQDAIILYLIIIYSVTGAHQIWLLFKTLISWTP